jgi:glycosyltransferase involved in cell wall biosynthesis
MIDMNRIKVLHIIKSLGRGGAETLLQEVLLEHNAEKFEFHFIYFLPWKNQMVAGIEANGGKVTLMHARNNIQIMRKLPEVIEYIRKHQINLVHAHLPWAGFLARFIHRRIGIPLIYTEHNIQQRYHWVTRTLNRITFGWQSMVIAVSDEVARSIQTTMHPSVQVTTILNGVDTNSFRFDQSERMRVRQTLGIAEDEVLIGVIAVFRFQKRLKEWIDVFKAAHTANPKLRGIIMGDGPLKAEIQAHLKESGMQEFIHMPGLVTPVKPYLAAMDLFMMTSSFEGLPIALLEAMSMECAVVSTNAGGIRQVIRNGEDGITVEVESYTILGTIIPELLLDAKNWLHFRKKARQRVEDAFSLKKMVRETEELYFQLLNKPCK